MNALPREMNEEILLRSDFPTLLQLCQTSHYYRFICENIGFWREKFTRESLPLYVLENYPTMSYLQIYQRALQAARKTDQEIAQFRSAEVLGRDITYSFNLADFSSSESVTVPSESNPQIDRWIAQAKRPQEQFKAPRRGALRVGRMETPLYKLILSLRREIYSPLFQSYGLIYYLVGPPLGGSIYKEITFADLADLLFRINFYQPRIEVPIEEV